ncbi:MAG: riboflavin synthase [Odoribacter sp.]|nr:riboflavin synthase [Odoribacter sp.]
MFTGIIEEIGKIKAVRRGTRSIVLEVEAVKVLEGTRIGDSIATNGVCLTVTALGSGCFSADVMPETMSRSNLGLLKPGDRVNLERALCLNSRLGGHIVAGHVDGTGRIVGKEQDENAIWITVAASPEVLRYMIEKGSIAIDGVSLTVAYVGEEVFKVSVIPHTQEETVLVSKRPGELVNLENDMIAKYVEKLTGGSRKTQGLSLEFLQENGFG